MTTRKHFGQIKKLSLDVLQPQAALELLQKLVGEERMVLSWGKEGEGEKVWALQIVSATAYIVDFPPKTD